MWTYLNDALVPVEEAKVSVMDRGFLYGDAVFETMAAFDGIIFRSNAHLNRLSASAELLGMTIPVARTVIERRLYECLEKNGRRDGILRLSVTRGRGTRSLDPVGCTEQTMVILCFPPRLYPARMLETGARVIVSTVRRTPAASLSPLAKTANFLNNILASREATVAGADEALMLNIDDAIAEGTVSNFFLVREGRVMTPSLDSGVMAGITRAAVIRTAGAAAIPVIEGQLAADELLHADEIFYTNTSAVIMPVGRIDDRALAAPGPVTSCLRAGLLDLIAVEAGRFWPASEAV